jgi:hypothetical protein
MNIKKFLRLYLRSAAGLINIFLPVLGFGLLLAFGLGPFSSVLLAAFSGAIVFFVALASGRASFAAVREKDRITESGYRASLDKVSEICSGLSYQRIIDSDISGRVSYIVQKAGRYIELAKEAGTVDPLANAALENCRNIINIYLKEIDDDSSEKRFRMDDLDPFEKAKERTLAALDREAAVIKDALTALDPDSRGNEKLSVMEDLEK